jgi:hypothetical protein
MGSWSLEMEMLSQWREYHHWLPNIPTQSRFNRRRRTMLPAFNLIRRVILESLDLAQDRQGGIDSLPLPAVQFFLIFLIPASRRWLSPICTRTYM